MRIRETKVYTFEELSEKAQAKAIEKQQQFATEYPAWWAENQNSLDEFCKVLGISWDSYDVDRGHISYTWDAGETVKELSGSRAIAWLWNNAAEVIHERKYIWLNKPFSLARPTRKYQSKIQYDRAMLTGYCMDLSLTDAIIKYLKNPSGTLKDLMNDCMHDWIFAVRDDYEYQTSEESARETIAANGYEFTEDGEIA